MAKGRVTADRPNRKAPEGSNRRAQVSPKPRCTACVVSQTCRGHIPGLGMSLGTCACEAQHPAPPHLPETRLGKLERAKRTCLHHIQHVLNAVAST